jgi:regulator of extracellular matrix RemA (YlzA/DUF370 family)
MANRILAATTLKAASVRRTVKEAQAQGLLLDFTGALECKGILIMDTGIVIRIPLRPMDIERILSQLDLDSK